MNLGSRLKQILEERNLNVLQLSRMSGVPAQTLYAMINRDSNKADMDIIAKLLDALEMDFMEFWGRDKSQEPRTKVKKEKKEEPAQERIYYRRELEDFLL